MYGSVSVYVNQALFTQTDKEPITEIRYISLSIVFWNHSAHQSHHHHWYRVATL